MPEMKNEQSWKTCEYRFPSKPEDKIACVSKKHELFESHNCKNEKIVKSRIYPTSVVREGTNGSLKQIACLHSISNHEYRNLIEGEFLEPDAIRLSVRAKEALRGCTHCRFYKSKEKRNNS